MEPTTLIVIAVGLLILFSGPVAAGSKWAWQRLPKLKAPTGLLTAKVEILAWKLAALVLLFWFAAGGGLKLPAWPDWKLPQWPSIAPKASLIVMLHEASYGPLSIEAKGAANELTAAGREVRMVDDDVTDGTGETPDWLKPALEPGRKIMGGTDGKEHALVVLSGERVIKAEKLPATKADIVEAVK